MFEKVDHAPTPRRALRVVPGTGKSQRNHREKTRLSQRLSLHQPAESWSAGVIRRKL
jgi:hypothetical protein